MGATLTVGALARRTNVTTKTVRYYEAIGLLPRAIRGENGYRYYPREAINRLSFIRRAKSLGLTLEEIGSLMALSDDGLCDIISPELRRVLERKVAEYDRQLEEIVAFRSVLAKAAARLTPCADDAADGACTSCSTFTDECSCLPPVNESVVRQSP